MQTAARVTSTGGMGTEPRYRPIGDYGVIGDCRTAALVGPDGSVDWCCLPHFDSPAIFCRLLDAGRGGYFQLRPEGQFQSSMSYLPSTNILETTFEGSGGRLRLVDFMPVRNRQGQESLLTRIATHLVHLPTETSPESERDTGNDVASAHRITRLATCLEGGVTLDVTLKATFDYARRMPSIERHDAGADTVAAILSADDHYLVFVVRRLPPVAPGKSPEPLALEGDDHVLRVRIPLTAGHAAAAVVNYARSGNEARSLLEKLVHHEFSHDLDETQAYWRGWAATSRYEGPYQDTVLRSALALKLCTFEPTGAIVAAPTTSLPEHIGGARNWDYRYTWLRDSVFTLEALENLGYYGEARDYFHFLHDLQIKRGSDLRIMYSIIEGESDSALEERTLDHLEGYRGSRPVRIGNGAAKQRQLDIYGEVMDAAYTYLRHEGFRRGRHNNASVRDLRDLAFVIADYVSNHWTDPDRGIWEIRGKPREFVYSHAMCWVALDRACKMAGLHGHEQHVPHWSAARDAIHADVLAHGYSEHLQSFTQSYGSEALDAAGLRLPLAGFLPWSDPRIMGTVTATRNLLGLPRGLMYRYRPHPSNITGTGIEGGPLDMSGDGLPDIEGTFVACSFWFITDLCYLGRVEEAREAFEHLLSFASPLGLFSEEIDPETGLLLGNFPQAFSHIGFIHSAVALQQAQEGTLKLHPRGAPFE